MKISQIIDKINDQQLFVPAFQREYVWKRNDAKNLIESLIKDYPTGMNSAYASYRGRFGKTIDDQPSINCDQNDQTDWIWKYILCFACTFRDVNTNEEILTWSKVTLIKNRKGCIKKPFICWKYCWK